MLGEHGVNIGSAAVGHTPPTAEGVTPAVMIVTTDAPVAQALLDEIIATEYFIEGRTVALGLSDAGSARRRRPAPTAGKHGA